MIDEATLVAALDAEDTRRGQLRQLLALHEQLIGSRVFVVHAQPPLDPVTRAFWSAWASIDDDIAEIEAERMRLAAQRLRASLQDLGAGKAKIELKVELGEERATILELAKKIGPTLFVLDAGGAGRGRLGCTTQGLLPQLPWPTLIRRSQMPTAMPDRLVLALDLSADSSQLLTEALSWADALGAQVQPIIVIPRSREQDHVGWDSSRPRSSPTKEERSFGSQRYKALLEQLDLDFGIRAKLDDILLPMKLLVGEPADTILAYGSEYNDWLVLGRAQRASGAELGRITERVARNAEVPLLVLPTNVVSADVV